MSEQDKNVVSALLEVILQIAPDATCRAKVVKVHSDAILSGASDLELLKTLANILADGLNHGNWPWSTFPADESDEPDKSELALSSDKFDLPQEGKKYIVRYKVGRSKYLRQAVMIFLGHDGTSYSAWSLRPLAGTQTLRNDDISSIEKGDSLPVSLPVMLK